jgi:hypothetical protein
MKESLANKVLEVEQAIRPLGFRIEEVARNSMSKSLFNSNCGKEAASEERLEIIIIRKGELS